MTPRSLVIRREIVGDAAAIDRLHARAFGPGRFARTAYRLREGVPALPDLCFAAFVGTRLVGSVRIGPAEAGGVRLLALGPLAVDPGSARRGIGGTLMERSLDAARVGGHALVVLVGDAPYYARFGFVPVPRGRLTLPGPVDPDRFLWLELAPGGCAQAAGTVSGPRRSDRNAAAPAAMRPSFHAA